MDLDEYGKVNSEQIGREVGFFLLKYVETMIIIDQVSAVVILIYLSINQIHNHEQDVCCPCIVGESLITCILISTMKWM